MTRLPHPIPYQGSKRKLAPLIDRYFPESMDTFYEPFAGSAAMTIHTAHRRRARRFVVADSHAPLLALLRSIVEEPEETASRYREIWDDRKTGDAGFFNRVRDRYNERQDPVDLLYLICRCVKNSIRFDGAGRFTQSVDRRRLGMRPERMRSAMVGVSSLLRGRTEFRLGDWRETAADACSNDFVYLDPPYLGTTIGRDKRYHRQLVRERLIAGLEDFRRRGVPFALSYDGSTGGREYGPPLPESLGLTRLLLHAGISSQSTLAGRNEETVESLYVTPGPVETPESMVRPDAHQSHRAILTL